MKRNIIIIACVLLAAIVLGLCGFTFASPEEAQTGEDRLVGLLITREYLDLFEFEGYANENMDELLKGGEISASDSEKYGGRLYAVIETETFTDEDGKTVEHRNYAFPDVEGMSCFVSRMKDEEGVYTHSTMSDGVTGSHLALSYTDEGEGIELTGGVIYVCFERPGDIAFYFNPVYQSADGRVYALSGDGMGQNVDEEIGVSSSHSMTAKSSRTVGDSTEGWWTTIEIGVQSMDKPMGVALLHMGADGELLQREEYAPGSLPESVSPAEGAEYIIVETSLRAMDGSESVSRELFGQEQTTLTAFYDRGDGICMRQYAEIKW